MFSISLATAGPRRRIAATRLAALALATTLLGAAGCGGSDKSTGPGDQPIENFYQLQTVDKAQLPTQLHHGPWLDPEDVTFYNLFDAKIVDGMVILDAFQEFYIGIEVDFIGDGEPGHLTFEFEGTYSVEGNTVYFTTADGQQGNGTIRNGRLALSLDVLGTGRFRNFDFLVD
jgi:ABC-type glycerol-3-phosphate transport system substrate-binding protein